MILLILRIDAGPAGSHNLPLPPVSCCDPMMMAGGCWQETLGTCAVHYLYNGENVCHQKPGGCRPSRQYGMYRTAQPITPRATSQSVPCFFLAPFCAPNSKHDYARPKKKSSQHPSVGPLPGPSRWWPRRSRTLCTRSSSPPTPGPLCSSPDQGIGRNARGLAVDRRLHHPPPLGRTKPLIVLPEWVRRHLCLHHYFSDLICCRSPSPGRVRR